MHKSYFIYIISYLSQKYNWKFQSITLSPIKEKIPIKPSTVFSFSKVNRFIFIFFFQSLLIMYHSIILTIENWIIRYPTILSVSSQVIRYDFSFGFLISIWLRSDFATGFLIKLSTFFLKSFLVWFWWLTLQICSILSGFHSHLKGLIERYVNHIT